MNLLSFFGIDAQLRKLRTAAGEGAQAVEDRVQLARLGWDEEKTRLKLLLALTLGLLGLTIVTLTIASFALIVHYWDAPYRATAAWSVATAWGVLWLGMALGVVYLLRRGSVAFGPTRAELGKDWRSLKSEILPDGRKAASPDRLNEIPPLDKEALLKRIALQRERLARQEAAVTAPTTGSARASVGGMCMNGWPTPCTRGTVTKAARGRSIRARSWARRVCCAGHRLPPGRV